MRRADGTGTPIHRQRAPETTSLARASCSGRRRRLAGSWSRVPQPFVSNPRRLLFATATVVALLALVAAEGAVGAPQRSLVASARTCPGSRSFRVTSADRQAALLCLINHARRAAGLGEVRGSRTLTKVAREKAGDVVTCSDFEHTACGKPAFVHVKASGFPYRLVGENLFYSERPVGTARDAFVAWLESPPHRRLIFLSRFTHAGMAVMPVDELSGSSDVELWVLELAQKA